jgi:four helix bundle protein
VSSESASQRDSKAGESKPPRRKIRTFRDLVAWQRAVELAVVLYDFTESMPAREQFGLTNQIRRAAVSVASNIAEGHARQTRLDYLRFLRMARGSLGELSTQLEIAYRARLLAPDQQIADLAAETARVLQALIRSLERAASRDEDHTDA